MISAKALTKTQISALEKSLKAAVGSDVVIDAAVDESLLGGLKVQVGSQMKRFNVKIYLIFKNETKVRCLRTSGTIASKKE